MYSNPVFSLETCNFRDKDSTDDSPFPEGAEPNRRPPRLLPDIQMMYMLHPADSICANSDKHAIHSSKTGSCPAPSVISQSKVRTGRRRIIKMQIRWQRRSVPVRLYLPNFVYQSFQRIFPQLLGAQFTFPHDHHPPSQGFKTDAVPKIPLFIALYFRLPELHVAFWLHG